MDFKTDVVLRCTHCGCVLVAAGPVDEIERARKVVLCSVCQAQPRGVCQTCQGDVLVRTDCWYIARQMDLALIKVNHDVHNCPQCKTVPLSIVSSGPERGSHVTRLQCPRCHGSLRQATSWTPARPDLPPDLPQP